MRALVLTQGDHYELQDVPVPTPAGNEIRVRVEASGVCGTDLHIMQGLFPAGRGRPLIMGHEFAGVVDAVGSEVVDFAPGDRVSADPNFYCGSCSWCVQGAYNLCGDWEALGITRHGALAEYVCVPAALAVHLPDEVSLTAAALIEPLSCAMHAFDRAGVGGDARTLVIGGGMLGLTSLVLARGMGHEVSVVEPHEFRREMARELGASATVAPAETAAQGEFDYVIEATGVPAAIDTAMSRLATRGTLLQLGVAPPDHRMELNSYDVYKRELRIVGSFSVANQFEPAAGAMETLAPELERLVTHRFALEDFADALTAMASPQAVKIHLNPAAPVAVEASSQEMT